MTTRTASAIWHRHLRPPRLGGTDHSGQARRRRQVAMQLRPRARGHSKRGEGVKLRASTEVTSHGERRPARFRQRCQIPIGSAQRGRKSGSKDREFWVCGNIGSWDRHLLELGFSCFFPKRNFWHLYWVLLAMLLRCPTDTIWLLCCRSHA